MKLKRDTDQAKLRCKLNSCNFLLLLFLFEYDQSSSYWLTKLQGLCVRVFIIPICVEGIPLDVHKLSAVPRETAKSSRAAGISLSFFYHGSANWGGSTSPSQRLRSLARWSSDYYEGNIFQKLFFTLSIEIANPFGI